MADFTADFEAGSNGNAVTTGAGEASATAWNGVFFDAPTYSNSNPAHGSLKALVASSGNSLLGWNLTSTEHYGRAYIYAPSNPPSNPSLTVTVLDGGTGVAKIYINTSGHINIQDSASGSLTTTDPIATGQWVRFEWHVIHSATVGQFEFKYFATADSSTATETLSSPASWNTHAAPTEIRFGALSGGSWQPSLDDIVANATSWPGPAASLVQTLRPSADSVDGAWTDQAGGTSLAAAIDEATFDDADYIRSDLNPSNSGCRVKLSAGGDPHVSTDHVIQWRTGKLGSATINMTVKMYQGGGNSQGAGTLIATFNRNNVGALTSYTETLSGGEADSITDYTDLYLEFFANTA